MDAIVFVFLGSVACVLGGVMLRIVTTTSNYNTPTNYINALGGVSVESKRTDMIVGVVIVLIGLGLNIGVIATHI